MKNGQFQEYPRSLQGDVLAFISEISARPSGVPKENKEGPSTGWATEHEDVSLWLLPWGDHKSFLSHTRT